jgi:hypothetical protein
MKCPKCGYTSFPYLESCRKCGHALTEQRAALGLYALRPDPPDLLLAFEAARADIIEATRTPPVSAPIDLGRLEEIDLDLEEAGPATPGPYEVGGQAAAAPDSMPTLEGEDVAEEEFQPPEPCAEQSSPQATIMPQTLDLSGLENITLELENAVDLEGGPAESAQPPKDSPEGQAVYDLDLYADLDALPLRPLADSSQRGDADDDEEVVEYTLEIEEDLIFEGGELELEQDEDAEAEDDDDR